jgi:hypothetical protein
VRAAAVSSLLDIQVAQQSNQGDGHGP